MDNNKKLLPRVPLKQKLIVVLGPTSVGKSDMAISLAKTFDGEVISADSRQVYKGAELLSGAVTEVEQDGIPHHLLSFRDIKNQYNGVTFVRDAEHAIKDISRRHGLPIVCGGTAMYIDALVYGQIFPEVKPNKELRAKLSGSSIEELVTILQKLDKKRAESIDTQNTRRLVRAIEIASTLGAVPEIQYREGVYDVLLIGLRLPEETLRTKIKARIEMRLAGGMKDEITQFRKKGVTWKRLYELGLEFKQTARLVRGEVDTNTYLEELYYDHIHYVKRQLTWWKRNKDIRWFSPNDTKEIKHLVKEFLK
jgi:tRNA dimethylallyltransferase